MAGTRRMKRVASNRASHEEDWNIEGDSSWEVAKGKVERMMSELVCTLKVLLNEARRPLADGVILVPVIQWALNAACHERFRACHSWVIFWRESATPFGMLAEEGADEWTVERVGQERVRTLAGELVRVQEQLHRVVLEQGRANSARGRISASKGSWQIFLVDDFRGGGQRAKMHRVAEGCEHLDGTLVGGVC